MPSRSATLALLGAGMSTRRLLTSVRSKVKTAPLLAASAGRVSTVPSADRPEPTTVRVLATSSVKYSKGPV